MAGIKTPFALFGALRGVSGQLSYHLTPNMYDGCRTLSLLLAFADDGFMADIVGGSVETAMETAKEHSRDRPT